MYHGPIYSSFSKKKRVPHLSGAGVTWKSKGDEPVETTGACPGATSAAVGSPFNFRGLGSTGWSS